VYELGYFVDAFAELARLQRNSVAQFASNMSALRVSELATNALAFMVMLHFEIESTARPRLAPEGAGV